MSPRLVMALADINVENVVEMRKPGRKPGRKPVISVHDAFEFCRLHICEISVIPEGLKRGYPDSINFTLLERRVIKLQTSLKAIIEQSKASSFRDEAFQKRKNMKGRVTTSLAGLSYIQEISPGYYGSKGSEEITRILVNLFVMTKVLTPELAHPLRQIEYVQEVLVPECGVLLIAEDRSIQPEGAQKVMLESVEFGNYMYDISNQ